MKYAVHGFVREVPYVVVAANGVLTAVPVEQRNQRRWGHDLPEENGYWDSYALAVLAATQAKHSLNLSRLHVVKVEE
jgi:hypothetical protein